MKTNLLKFCLVVLCAVLGVSAGWAEVITLTENFSASTATSDNYNCSSSLGTDNNRAGFDYSWSSGGSGTVFKNGIKLGAGSSTGFVESGTILDDIPSGTEFTVKVYAAVWNTDGGKIVATYHDGNGDEASYTKEAANAAITSTSSAYSASAFASSTDFTFTKDSKWKLKIASSAKRVIIDKVEIVYSTSGGSTPGAGEGVKYTFSSFTQANDVALEADGYTITLHKNTGGTAPQWNSTSNEARVYAKGSVDVTSTKNIVKVVYDYIVNANNKGNVPTIDGVAGENNAGTWNAETKTWTGSDKKVTLTTSGAAGNVGFKKIIVYFEEEAPATSGTLNLVAQDSKGDYYATFSADKDVIFLASQLAEVQTVFTDGDELLLESLSDESWAMVEGVESTESYGYYVPANTGVIICSSSADVTYYDVKDYEYNQNVSDFSDNMLVAASVAMTGANKFYKLAYDNYDAKSGLGFYWGAADGAAFTCKTGTAYLAVPNNVASNVRGFSFDGGVVTSIKSVENKTGNVIYDLSGRRVNRLQQGVNIVNGKKVIR